MAINFYKTAREGKQINSDENAHSPALKVPMASSVRTNWLETPSTVIVAAGIGFFSLAVATQGIIPLVTTKIQTSRVDDVVTQTRVKVPPYTPQEQRGRKVYIREGCWYCHSQYIRPVTGETFRWGPVSQAGEHIHDRPHFVWDPPHWTRFNPDWAPLWKRLAYRSLLESQGSAVGFDYAEISLVV